MTDITSPGPARVVIPRSGNRWWILYHDAALLMCTQCGGSVRIIMHVVPGLAWLPNLKDCKCAEKPGGER